MFRSTLVADFLMGSHLEHILGNRYVLHQPFYTIRNNLNI